ncbi:MAG: hypothetical protein HOV77_19440 [Hamadaea sp.]|uniref:DUF6896 domain-containing protein n=1 Tax=Hamadaea sp. TaxID=2024425 RepID=UPI0017FDDD96|nr:hypothetical protein [Hamadaea sp.]NUT21353.1 hypothetical protein [Hamadaea sp.]
MADLPTTEQLSRLVQRGHGASYVLDEGTDPSTASDIARRLKMSLPADVLVIMSPFQPPRLRVLRLISDDEAASLLPTVHRLVADFRAIAGRLVGVLRHQVLADYDAGRAYAEEIEVDGVMWSLHMHGEHCRLESAESGQVVEAHLDDPDALDPYFLLEYARTSPGGYPDLLTACIEGFHDTVRLMELAGYR